MPTTRRRTSRLQVSTAGLTEADYTYFTFGDFFEAEGYEDGKTEEELKAFWEKHREAILRRYHRENRHPDMKPYAVERWEEASNADT